jgi:hypothetical protein
MRANSITAATLARLRRARYSASFKSKTSFVCLVCSYQNMNDGGFYEKNQPTDMFCTRELSTYTSTSSAASGLADRPIRWLVDDCAKFVAREKRRGNTYDGIIMDPPSYGRGPGGEIWKLEDCIYDLISQCEVRTLISSQPVCHIGAGGAGLALVSTQRPGHAHSIQSTVIQIFLFIRDDLQRHTGKIHARQGIQAGRRIHNDLGFHKMHAPNLFCDSRSFFYFPCLTRTSACMVFRFTADIIAVFQKPVKGFYAFFQKF